MDMSSTLIVKKPYPAVAANGSIKPVFVNARIDIMPHTAIIPISFNSHIHITAFDFKLSGYIYINSLLPVLGKIKETAYF